MIKELIYGNRKSEMTPQELKAVFDRLGLNVPETECRDIARAIKHLDEMKASVRKPRSAAEPACYSSLKSNQ